MDYTKQNLSFKIRKTLRYLKLYGPTRTLIKVKGQYHMNKKFSEMPKLKKTSNKQVVGLLG